MAVLDDMKNCFQWCLPKDLNSAPESSAMSLFIYLFLQKLSRKHRHVTDPSHCRVVGVACV